MPMEKGCPHAEKTGIERKVKSDVRITLFGRGIAHDGSGFFCLRAVAKVKNRVVPTTQVHFGDTHVRVFLLDNHLRRI
jgi:hypothetical protein